MKKTTLAALISDSVITFTGCTSTSNSLPSEQPQTSYEASIQSQSILNAELEQLWSQDIDHYQPGLLLDVAGNISKLAQKGDLNNTDLERFTYYLRIFSSFGPDKDWKEGSAEALNQALIDLQSMKGFYDINKTTARLHENYSVALYRLYFIEELQPLVSDHVQPLSKLINLYASSELPKDIAIDYALWEVLRAGAILPYEAKRKNKDQFTNAIHGNGELEQSLINFLDAKNAYRNESNWPQKHALWALGQYYNLYAKQYWNDYYKKDKATQKLLDDDEMSLPYEADMDKLDNSVWQILSSTNKYNEGELKTLFSVPYVVSTFRGKSECEKDTLENRCISPTIDEALPIKHVCSDSVYIRTQTMTEAQLADSCKKMISQDEFFHQTLATNQKPVANDFNEQLRVVIFEDSEQYNTYGQLTFDIHTDNGGMYIEGTPQDPDNIATFYSYEHFWVRPEFAVWNLNHEFVHYLDGRFAKYAGFGHFPSNMVWWSEGLAEYISKQDDNPRAFKLVKDTKKEEWPSLMDVFNTEYKDGTDRVYRWGYLAVRFMVENHKEDYLQMANFLKTDFFDGYKRILDKSGEQYGEEFTQWLSQHLTKIAAEEKVEDKTKPRQFYRYTYRNSLKPAHLIENEKHMHWQYWHENALKSKAK